MNSPPPARFPFTVLLLLLSASAVVGIAAWLYLTKIQPTSEPLYKLHTALEKITNQEISSDGYSLEIQTSETQELITVERSFQSIIKYETTFLGSRKVLILRGNFIAKAGFDLSKADQFTITDGSITGSIGRAKILSVEMVSDSFELYHAQDTAFNKLKPADHARATQLLLEQARKDAENSDLRQRAEAQIQERLQDLSGIEIMQPL